MVNYRSLEQIQKDGLEEYDDDCRNVLCSWCRIPNIGTSWHDGIPEEATWPRSA